MSSENIDAHEDPLKDLFSFYHDYVKVLYGTTQASGTLSQETLFEINAAFDHISRIYAYGESADNAARKAYGHLKRSCFDIFKVGVREANRQYKELREIDTSIIDNGEFDKKLIALFGEIKKSSAKARQLEGKPGSLEEVDSAFNMWQPVYERCLCLEDDFYENDKVEWAKQKERRKLKKER
ncbi:MAG: hypothetical protein LBF91_09030 [Azoarcus sp.]|jgi:hypothetical protein|nr:hypothetical protein [Azoarcus sp.]